MSKDTLFQVGDETHRAGDVSAIDERMGLTYVRLHGDQEQRSIYTKGSPSARKAWQAALLVDDSPKTDPDSAVRYARLAQHADKTTLYIIPSDVNRFYCGGGRVPCMLYAHDKTRYCIGDSVEEVRAALASPKTLAEWGDDDAEDQPGE